MVNLLHYSLPNMSKKESKSIASTIRDYGNRLWGFVKGKVKNESDAEDVMQDIWYQLSRLTNIEDLESVSGWLYEVARNRIADLYRKKQPDSLQDLEYEDEDGALHFKDILLMDDSNDPELAFFKELFWKELLAALDELPENQKQVFVLNELEGISLQAIADQSGENLKTIISRKGYAVKHLRNKLAYLYQELNL